MTNLIGKGILGKWYAKEPHRYLQFTDKKVDQYKMYVYYIGDQLYYDSFYLTGTQVVGSKNRKETQETTLLLEIEEGHLVRAM